MRNVDGCIKRFLIWIFHWKDVLLIAKLSLILQVHSGFGMLIKYYLRPWTSIKLLTHWLTFMCCSKCFFFHHCLLLDPEHCLLVMSLLLFQIPNPNGATFRPLQIRKMLVYQHDRFFPWIFFFLNCYSCWPLAVIEHWALSILCCLVAHIMAVECISVGYQFRISVSVFMVKSLILQQYLKFSSRYLWSMWH